VSLGFRPGPEPPFGLLERLHTLNKRLGLLWFESMQRWGVTFDWADSDPRRARVQLGEIRPTRAFDLLTILPEDCPAADAAGYLERSLRQHPSKDAVRSLLSDIEAENAKARKEVLRPALEVAEELLHGRGIRTRLAPSRIDRDAKRRRDFFHDTGL
jgi:hypothetical protein